MSSTAVSTAPQIEVASRAWSATFGRVLFAMALMGAGLQQLIRGEFVRLVPALPAWWPSPAAGALASGVILILAGIALLARKRVRLAATIVGALLLASVLILHLREIVADPLHGFRWTNPFKALALFGGCLLVVRSGRPHEAPTPAGLVRPAPGPWAFLPIALMSAFLVICGLQHFAYTDFAAQLIPAWIPAHMALTYFTGVALIAGGVGILISRTRFLAALWCGGMILSWVALLHLPRAFAELHAAGEWGGVFEATALSGVAFLIAGTMRR